MQGTQIGSYLIERQLGQGGFGVVYVGVDVRLGRRAAIKQLLPELSGHRDIVERFFNEAKAAANINHPGIVEIYDVGWHTDGSAYFAMKLLDGDSLAKRLRETGPMSVQLAATIARQVSSALVAAHTRGIVHRDLKPDNIILVPDEEVAIGERATVLDFGIAKLVGDKPASQKTRTGMMMGTPAYMSPEQCRGAGEVDHRTDVYALGCILFEMLTGRPPFVGEGAGEVLGMHQFVEPPTVRSLRADVPAELEAVIMRALSKKPEQRAQQMTELTASLQPFAAAGARSMEHAAQRVSAAQSAANLVPVTIAATGHSTPAKPDAISEAARVANVPPQQSTFSAAGAEVIASPAPQRRGRLPLIVVGGVVAVGAIVVAVVMSSSDPAPRPASAPPADAAVTVTQVSSDAAVVAIDTAVASADPSGGSNAMRAECAEHAAKKMWGDLDTCAGKLAATDPATARALKDRAIAEIKAELALDDLKRALQRRDLVAARTALDTIGEKSVYRRQADEAYRAAEKAMVETLVSELKALSSGDCRKYNARVRRAEQADGKAIANQAHSRVGCTAATAEVTAPDDGSLDELVTTAQDAAKRGQYGRALNLAEQALAKQPTNMLALTVAAIAACNLKNRDKATRYFRKLPANRASMMRQICLRNGVSVDIE